ncbi:hypothetical protein COCON_G00222170 [Conger conger]|uniref:Uncharacterized protein n=1 Tax=Conger conger TaxID=82655 RepID=A0A9Q1CVG6_CONCO|nr:hypothetical protein COCON_G00222170 [Conger conger]
MEEPRPKEGMLKIPSEATTIRLVPFSFVPVLRKLPSEGKIAVGEQETQPMQRTNEYVEKPMEAAAGRTMPGDGVFKADFVVVGGDLDEREPGARRAQLARETTLRQEALTQYKIKSSYKAIAAIPTNTLLLEQQAIDEEVEKEGRPLEDVDVVRVTETHSEMCSPAQLRQQSEELYAAIDQVLQDPLPMRRSQSAPLSLVTLAEVEVPRRLTPVPRSAGRETKYAAFHLQPVGSAERTLTKPGVIRPVMVIPRLTEEEAEEDFPNPFRQQYLKEISEEQTQKFVSSPAGQLAQLAERHRESGSPTFRKGDIARNDETLLLITEKEDSGTPPMAGGASKTASFNPAQGKRQVRETHI